MARCCGSSGTCACKISGGRHINVSGTGTSQDPFVVSSNATLAVSDSTTFDLGLSGTGTSDDPWVLQVGYANGSRLTDVPDVNAASPTDGHVLAWNETSGFWEPIPATVAEAGAVATDQSLSGDGSLGAPLAVRPDDTRFITVTVNGVGLSDDGLNAIIRPFADATARAAASPAPEIGAVSMLLSEPGRLDFWDGADWSPITNGLQLDVKPGEVLALSGSYAGGTVTQYVTLLSETTDVNGQFTVIPAVDLTGYAGVLSVHVQPVGSIGWTAVVDADTDRIVGTAYRLDDGTPYAGYTLSASVSALLY